MVCWIVLMRLFQLLAAACGCLRLLAAAFHCLRVFDTRLNPAEPG
jgi:hypothetical protein